MRSVLPAWPLPNTAQLLLVRGPALCISALFGPQWHRQALAWLESQVEEVCGTARVWFGFVNVCDWACGLMDVFTWGQMWMCVFIGRCVNVIGMYKCVCKWVWKCVYLWVYVNMNACVWVRSWDVWMPRCVFVNIWIWAFLCDCMWQCIYLCVMSACKYVWLYLFAYVSTYKRM